MPKGCNHSPWYIAISSGSKNHWAVRDQVRGTPVQFKINTGAEVTLIFDSTHEAVGSQPLKKSDRILRGPSNCKLPVLGWFEADLTTEMKTCSQKLYVVNKLHVLLLGCPPGESRDTDSDWEYFRREDSKGEVPQRLPRTQKAGWRLPYLTQAWCHTLLPRHTKTGSDTSDISREVQTGQDGEAGGNCEGDQAD